ncbi:MAG TPA: cyclic-di-AMP-binding protein CbpB [Pseudogracilibacillus sp.]|nr:cyclic-di-AMP-binding protein CbpB [Pseudogracilibacillus sp.]
MSVTQENWELDELMVHEMMISSEKVAHVQSNNPLEHALLVLVKSGYSAVPVLDTEYKLVGLISKTVILNEILGLERFETERLSEMKVSDVMNKEEISIKETATFVDGLNALINRPFICVTDDKGHFDGILTRRAILKELKKDYYMSKNK